MKKTLYLNLISKSAMNGIDTELVSFLRTIVSIESEIPPVTEVLTSDVLKNRDVGYKNDPLNCVALQRVYYSSKGERMPVEVQLTSPASEGLRYDNSTTTTKDSFMNNNECTSFQAVHFGPPKISFPDQICEQTTKDSFRQKKRGSMDQSMTAEQEGNIRLVEKQRNCKIRKTENAHYPVVSETFQETRETTFEERGRNANVNGYDQAGGTRTPRLRGTKSRASFAGIDGLFNSARIRSFNKGTESCVCYDIQLQRYNQVTNEKTSNKVFKGKAPFIGAGAVMPRCSSNAVSYLQERYLINNYVSESMDTTPLKRGYQHSTTQQQTEQGHETVAAEETQKERHATKIREEDRVLQKWLHPAHNRHDDGEDYIMWNGKCHKGHQTSREYKVGTDKNYNAAGLITSRDDEPPKSTFARSCSTFDATEQTTTTLRRATQHVQPFSGSSPAVPRDRKQQRFTIVPHWYLKNGQVSREESSSVHNAQQRSSQQHVYSDRKNQPTNFQRLVVSSSLDGVERSLNREISSSFQSSQGIISRDNSFTPPLLRRTPSSADILNSKTEKNLALTTKRKIFMCKFQSCSRIFHTLAGLICHQSLHTGKRSFACPWENCDRTFMRNDQRSRHIRGHTGEKPYECPYCAKCFSRSDHRSTHVKKMHNEKEMPVYFTNS